MAKFYDWRPNASRAIFFLGDEALEGGNTNGKQDEADIEAASRAIDEANEAGVRVHMYMGTSSVMPQVRKAIEAEYVRVADKTGGKSFNSQDTFSGFQTLLQQVICGSRPPPKRTSTEFCCCQQFVDTSPAPHDAASDGTEGDSSDEPRNRPKPLTEEQQRLDLLTQLDLAYGIKESALFSKQGLVAASRSFKSTHKDTKLIIDWLEHRLDAAIAALNPLEEEGPKVKIGHLSTHFHEPPAESGSGAVPIYGSDMYTLVFYRRGSLWLLLAYDYELDIPYLDFETWQRDVLAFVSAFGL